MSNDVSIQMSQGLEVLRPKSGKAYPIPCDEWRLLKNKIEKLTSEPWLFHSIGFVLFGAALSTFVTILLGTFQLPAQQRALDLAWAFVAVTLICGVACLFFANKERTVHRERANDVVAQMELIETRYECSSP
jgi:Na+/melibiose symporter-like transporter